MNELLEDFLKESYELFDKAIAHLNEDLTKIRAGKANPAMLKGIMVEYYGNPTPLSQVANVNTADSRTLSIQPWEKPMLAVIEQALFAANLGITPMNDGETIRLSIPPTTEERRKELYRQAKGLGEDAKISLRSARHKMLDFIKKEVKDGYPEDLAKRKESEIDGHIKSYTDKVDKMIEMKEKDIMTV